MTFELIRALIGTWELVATSAVDAAGKATAQPYGPLPRGLLSFGVDGRMMCVLCDGRPSLPDDAPEREYNSYCGNFEFDGETLITRVDASSNEAWIGGQQVRRGKLDGDRLILVNGRRTLIWERVGSAG